MCDISVYEYDNHRISKRNLLFGFFLTCNKYEQKLEILELSRNMP